MQLMPTRIARPDHSLLVAVEDGAIFAVGVVTDAGEIILNYVFRDARLRGVSKILLRALEVGAAERGNTHCAFASTETARRFYISPLATVRWPPVILFGMQSYPMSKRLPVQPIFDQNRGTLFRDPSAYIVTGYDRHLRYDHGTRDQARHGGGRGSRL